MKDIDQKIVKFTNRKDCLRILRVSQLKGLDPSAVDLPKEPKFSLMRACTLTIEGYRTNVNK